MSSTNQELLDVGLTELIGGGTLTRTEPSVGATNDPVVSRTIRDLLGWTPKRDDVKGFVAAISRSYRIVEVEGIERVAWTPYGYSLQADIGAITGAQASIAKQGQMIRAEAVRIIEGLVPLR